MEARFALDRDYGSPVALWRSVNTTPEGADCALWREGVVIGRVNPTPGAVTIKKTKHDITIKCIREGFVEASYFNKSDVAGATVGNILLGGGIGWAVDSAAGADNKYESPVNITLVPVVVEIQTETTPEGQEMVSTTTVVTQ